MFSQEVFDAYLQGSIEVPSPAAARRGTLLAVSVDGDQLTVTYEPQYELNEEGWGEKPGPKETVAFTVASATPLSVPGSLLVTTSLHSVLVLCAPRTRLAA